MRKDELLEKINVIEDQYIAEAEETAIQTLHHRKHFLIIFGSLAAVFVIGVTGLALKLTSKSTYPVYPTTSFGGENEEEGTIEETVQDIMTEEIWENMALCYKFRSIEWNGRTYEANDPGEAVFTLGEALGSVSVTGQEALDAAFTERAATLYRIENISEDVLLGLIYEGSEDVFVCLNPWYQPDTLGDFITALDLENQMTVEGVAYIYEQDEKGNYHSLYLEGLTTAEFYEELFTPYLSTPAAAEEQAMSSPSVISFSVSVPILGQHHISFWLTENGYLNTNVGSTRKGFDIGKENAEKILAVAKENMTIYEIVQPKAETLPEGTEAEIDPAPEMEAATAEETVVGFTSETTAEGNKAGSKE